MKSEALELKELKDLVNRFMDAICDEPKDNWRLMSVGETLQKGDEIRVFSGSWSPVPPCSVGGTILPSTAVQYRRAQKDEKDATMPNEQCTCPTLDGHKVTGSSCPVHGLPSAEFTTPLQMGVFETIELHRLIATGKGESPEAAMCRDKIDGALKMISESDKTFLREASAKLQAIYHEPVLAAEGQDDALAWLVFSRDGDEELFHTKEEAELAAKRLPDWERPAKIAPLHRIADEECAAVRYAMRSLSGEYECDNNYDGDEKCITALRGLLKRVKNNG